MAQFARPDGDVTNGGTGGFGSIDEATPSDADFWWGPDGTAAELEVSLSNVDAPGAGDVIFRYRIAKTNDGVVDGAGNACTVTARLMQGATQIATDTAKTATGTWTQYAYTLTAGEKAAITDPTDLRLEFVTSASGGNPTNRRGAAVSWAELELPDAGAAPPEWEQVAFRFRNDDGGEALASWAAPQNTDGEIDPAVSPQFRLRFELNQIGGSAATTNESRIMRLQRRLNGGAWGDVGAASSVAKAYTSAEIPTEVVTTDQLTAGSGPFQGGATDNGDAVLVLNKSGGTHDPGEHTEIEFCVELVPADLAPGDTVDFRVVGAHADTNISTYTVADATVSIPVSVSGDAAQTLPALAQDAIGDALVDGAVAQTLPALSQDAAGVVSSGEAVTGDVAQTLPALTQDAAATAAVDGTAASGLPALAQAADGALGVDGAAAASLPALAQDAAGSLGIDGAAASGLPTLGQDAAGALLVEGSAAQTLPALSQDAAGSAGDAVAGGVENVLPALAQDSSGALGVDGDVAQTLPALEQSATGTAGDAVAGGLAQDLPALTQSADGTVSGADVSGAAASVLPGFGQEAAGTLTVTGEAGGVLGALATAAGGTLVVAGEAGLPTIRAVLQRQLFLAANVGAQLGIVSDQVLALRRGEAVTVTREQLQQFRHPSLPANVDDHPTWTLTGDNTLTP